MGKRLFVGNLPYEATGEQLREVFGRHGRVTDVHLVMDRETGRPRGFAFVSYATDEEAAAAVAALDGADFGGRKLVVNEARERGSGPPPGGSRPGGAARTGGGHRPQGSRPGGFRPGPPPPVDLPPAHEERRRTRKKHGPQKERAPKPRWREEEDDLPGGNWRQWLNELDEDE